MVILAWILDNLAFLVMAPVACLARLVAVQCYLGKPRLA